MALVYEGGKEANVKHRGANKIPESPHKASFGPGVSNRLRGQ